MRFSAISTAALALVAGILIANCQCGHNQNSPTEDSGSQADGGVGDGSGGADGGDGGDGGAGGDDGGLSSVGVCTLKANGETCTAAAECCSSVCDPQTGTCNCVALGDTCQSNSQCCAGKTCAEDGTGVKRCIDESFCKLGGEPCTLASECCSLSCNETCQTHASLCAIAGASCATDAECCSNDCTANTCIAVGQGCSTLGEACTDDTNCCSFNCQNFATDGGTNRRCAVASACNARGELCTRDIDCCSGACLDGVCPSQKMLNQKRFAGEPCLRDSDCASYTCASSYPGAPKTCDFAGGCRPAEEICTDDYQCCGYLELTSTRDSCQTAQVMPGTCAPISDVPGVKRCLLQQTDKEVGEICASSGSPVHKCCGGAEACQPTITGVSRCLYGGGFSPDSGCTPNGKECSISDQCCSKICAPGTLVDGGTGLLCSGCVANGGACTANNDCCEQTCMYSVCRPSSALLCTPLGGACTDNAQCCSLLCATGVGASNTCVSQIN